MKKILAYLWVFSTSTLVTLCQEIEINGETEVELEVEEVYIEREKDPYKLKNIIDIKDGKHGYYDQNGYLAIPYKYDSIISSTGYLSNKNVIAIKNRKYGLINKQNQIIIPFKYQFIKRVREGEFLVNSKNKMGLISSENKVIIELEYENLKYSGVNDLFFVTKNKSIGVIDKTGKYVVDPIYSNITYNKDYWAFNVTNKNQKKGVISLSNQIIIPAKYDSIEGESTKFIVVKDSLYGAYSFEHGMILPTIYDYIKPFDKRLDFNAIIAKDDQYSLVSNTGNVISQKKYEKITECGLQFLCTIKNEKKGLLNKKGVQILDNEYVDIRPFTFRRSPHRIFVKRDKLFALFNQDGHQLTPYSFENIKYVGSVIFFAVTKEKSGKVGLLKMDGTMTKDFMFDYVHQSQGEILGVIGDKKYILGTY